MLITPGHDQEECIPRIENVKIQLGGKGKENC